MFAYGISSQFNSVLTRLSPVSLIIKQLNSGWTLVHALTWENVCVSNICSLLWTFVVELFYFSVKLRVCLREMTLEYKSFCIHFVNSKGHFIWCLSSGWGKQQKVSTHGQQSARMLSDGLARRRQLMHMLYWPVTWTSFSWCFREWLWKDSIKGLSVTTFCAAN